MPGRRSRSGGYSLSHKRYRAAPRAQSHLGSRNRAFCQRHAGERTADPLHARSLAALTKDVPRLPEYDEEKDHRRDHRCASACLARIFIPLSQPYVACLSNKGQSDQGNQGKGGRHQEKDQSEGRRKPRCCEGHNKCRQQEGRCCKGRSQEGRRSRKETQALVRLFQIPNPFPPKETRGTWI
jgi:hypothetical protein